MYKVLGADKRKFRHGRCRTEIGVECTIPQGIEIELEYSFYESALDEDMERVFNMFIQKNDIFPPNSPTSNNTESKPLTTDDINMYNALKKRSRTLMIKGE
jgi:hypothetical protein